MAAHVPRAPAHKPGPQGALRAEALLGTGSLPSFGPGLALAGWVGGRTLRAEVRAEYFTPRRTWSDLPGSPGAELQRFGLGARVCAVARKSRFEFPACAGATAGAVVARGLDVADARVDHSAYVAADLSLGASVVLGPRIALTLGGALAVPLLRPRFEVQGAGEIYRAPPVAGHGALGLETRFR